jgi:hypothetical protein
MTKRIDVSVLENSWHDAQRVTKKDLDTEQNRNNQIDAAIVNNHFGSGVLPFGPQQVVLFDSDNLSSAQAALVSSHNFDGTGLLPAKQPTDLNLGNQLEIELTDSQVFGRLSVKVAVIGLAFDDTLQMDRFYFYKNEKQVTSKHYKKILAIFFNDFKGNTLCSRQNGGRVVIRETASFQLSRDPLMVVQDVEPDLFWRDFKVSSLNINLFDTIQVGIGNEYDADALSINVTGRPSRTLLSDDVTSQVGQKFQAQTNNIQKVTLLLGVSKNTLNPVETEFDWAGELVISIYPLQTTTSCPTDIIPELAIDFEPASEPLAQLSINQSSLRDLGYVLTDVLQPVDFVFNSTRIASPATSNVIPGNFYAITLRRSGAATQGTVLIGCGNDRVDNSRVTLFGGTWVDVPEEDLWFQIWTDAAKVADGQGYDAGNGVLIAKTQVDEATGAVVDHQAKNYSLADAGENIVNTAVIQAIEDFSVTTQDERTGNPVFSRKQFVPSFSFVTDTSLTELKAVSEPLVIGAIQDTNPKQNPTLAKIQTLPGLAKNDTFCIVNPDADLLSLNLLGSKLIPNDISCGLAYKIFKVTLCTDGYGDVNGDGTIDLVDIAKASSLIGESVYSASSQQKIIDGEIDVLELLRADVDGDGYITSNDVDLITNYVNKSINAFPIGSSFLHLCLRVQSNIGRYDGYFDCDGYVRLDGYGGLDIIDPGSLSPAELIYDGYIITPDLQADPIFTTVPFPGVTYQIVPQPYWQPHLLAVASDVRLVPASFTAPEAIVPAACSTPVTYQCEDKNEVTPTYNPGRNDFFVPDNLYVGKGQILRPDGSAFKVDFEIGTIILQLPQEPLSESSINVFSKFVADRGDGFTRAGYPAMRYADCTTVQDADLLLNKVKFSVSIQSFVPNLDGYTFEDGYGIIVDDIIGIHLDPLSGILKLTVKDLSVDPLYLTLVSKIQILAYLKKGGWNNQTLEVRPSEIAGLISS